MPHGRALTPQVNHVLDLKNRERECAAFSRGVLFFPMISVQRLARHLAGGMAIHRYIGVSAETPTICGLRMKHFTMGREGDYYDVGNVLSAFSGEIGVLAAAPIAN